TNNQKDAWFSGFDSHVVTSVWVGFDQPAPLGHYEVGARAALPIWVNYMRTALAGYPPQPLVPPPGIVTAMIDRRTGLLASPSDPRAMQEYFIQGTVPKAGIRLDASSPGAPPPESVRQGLF
ncbi:MAG: peptidase, partial [Gammaproteobacteria bacterium]|nr:peptidase [Gammaproteobacteria bacterium]